MAQSSACCSPRQNCHDGKDRLAGGTSTEENDCWTAVPAASRAPTPAVASNVAPIATSGSANSSVVKYLKDDFQRIFRIVLESRLVASILAPATAPHYKGPCERSQKAWFPGIYWDKTHLEFYNFFQQCKDHFAIADATGPNRVLFAALILKETALFRWQQHPRKIKTQTNVFISWGGFKAFFCQSLSEFEAFVDTIWNTIMKDS